MKKGSLVKSTAIVMGVALISRFLGFIRDILIASNFGAGSVTDAYNVAVTVPETIFMVVGLAISTSFVPMLSKVRSQKGNEEMHKFANNIINILFVISVSIFIIASIFPEGIVGAVANDFAGEQKALAVTLTRITLVNILFLSVNACFTALLQVHEDFVIPSMLGLFFNLPMIIYLLVFKNFDIYGLTIANVIGNLFRVAVQIPSLRSHGFKFKLFINLKDERIKKLLIIIVPVIIGAGANSFNLIVDKNIASGLGDGSIASLDFAQKLIFFVNSIITTSIATVAYPLLANTRNEGKSKEFLDVLTKSIIYLAILLIPITIGMAIYGSDIVSLVYERGAFDAVAVGLTATALLGYTFGIFFTGVRDILNSTLFSMGKTKITAINGVIGVVINVVLSIIFSKMFGIIGIAIASSIAMMVTSIMLLISIARIEGQLSVKDLVSKLIKILIATLLMGIVVLIIKTLVGGLPIIIGLLLGVVGGAIVYFIAVYCMKLTEVTELIGFMLKKVGK